MMKLILILFSFIFVSCNLKGEKIKTVGATEKLEKIISNNINNRKGINPKIALNLILEFYKENDKNSIKTKETPIELYVIYNTDYWTENSKTFEITFANQIVERIDSILYEYRITLIYNPKEFEGIKEFDLRYTNKDNLEFFKTQIQQSVGYNKALLSKPIMIEIIREEI